MELHQLRYFVTVADLGNFTRAAEKCLVAQPSLSQQIIKLERELGRPVFERLGRTVRLTDAGRVLYEQAVSVLATVDEAKRRVTELAETGSGTIAVGVIPTVAPYLLPALLKKFRSQFPRAAVKVYERVTEQTIRGCLEGELDVGLLALPIAEPHLAIETLLTEELLLALAANHPLTRKKHISMQDISGEDFILLSETHCLGEQIVSFCKQQGCMPPISCYSAQLLTVQELVGMGHGISLIPRMAAAADRSKQRKYRSLSGSKPVRTLGLIWHKQRYQSALAIGFREIARLAAGDP